MDILRGIIGLGALVGIAWLLSENRKAINWRTVGVGIGFQILIGALILFKHPFENIIQVEDIFTWIGEQFVHLVDFTKYGVNFLFASFVTGELEVPLVNFAFTVLPIIIFFSALTSLLYYLGILQKMVYAFAWLMKRLMGISGASPMLETKLSKFLSDWLPVCGLVAEHCLDEVRHRARAVLAPGPNGHHRGAGQDLAPQGLRDSS